MKEKCKKGLGKDNNMIIPLVFLTATGKGEGLLL